MSTRRLLTPAVYTYRLRYTSASGQTLLRTSSGPGQRGERPGDEVTHGPCVEDTYFSAPRSQVSSATGAGGFAHSRVPSAPAL